MSAVCVVVAVVASGLAGARWLRVAQREHYLPGSVVRYAARWWRTGPNLLLLVAVVLGVALAHRAPLAGAVGALAVAVGPFGLTVRGRTGRLVWTRRMTRAAAVWVVVQLGWLGVGAAVFGPTIAAVAGAAFVEVFVDVALLIMRPVEDRLVRPFVEQATKKLAQVSPTVVAITGSYGKTSTKNFVAHLVSGTRQVVPTPKSFNNRAGLARAVNEHLALGTEVFVAEMGTYGKGEIAAMVSWCPPDIAVITAIGPVHLERMKSEAAIVSAKAEILEPARVVVLNVDDEWLAPLADRLIGEGRGVVRCSGRDRAADVAVIDGSVYFGGVLLGEMTAADFPATNVACAVAVALELGVAPADVAGRLSTLPVTDHRQTVSTGAGGFTIIDDTYNANPAGAVAALASLSRHAADGHKVALVTPGMVELGARQREENARFAAAASAMCTHIVVVGHTNRAALLEGARVGAAEIVSMHTRDDAVVWVKEHLGPGDVVLYENDVHDHVP